MGVAIKRHFAEKRTRWQEYDEMRHEFDVCWACGKNDKPEWWHAPWMLHRAHIANQPRLRDRRCVIMLCPVCHGASHGERYPGRDVPPIEMEHMLWLKMMHDPEYLDVQLIQECSIRRLPTPVPYNARPTD